MSLYKFEENSVFVNQMEANPYSHFFVYSGEIIYNKDVSTGHTGSIADFLNHTTPGNLSLYEYNVDRPSDGLIYPWVEKTSTQSNLKTIALDSYRGDFAYGATITGSYPLTASISKIYRVAGVNSDRPYVAALKNTLDYYINISQHYAFSSSLGDKSSQEIGLVPVPSIFYGSAIRKGSVNLKFYITGSLVGHLIDDNRNGALIEQLGTNSGSVGGVVLYNEGFMVLTGSWDISEGDHTEVYNGSTVSPAWVHFGASMSGSITCPSSSFEMHFEGTTKTPVLTMLAHAPRAELNYSSNPTFASETPENENGCGIEETFYTGSGTIWREPQKQVFNTMSSSYALHSASFEHQTFISSIGIFDEDKNLVGIARMARPVRKQLTDEYTFKLKLDI